MKQEKDFFRVFVAAKVQAPWPEMPKGKAIKEENRHITICFLGELLKENKEEYLDFPKPGFLLSPVGRFTKCVGMPKRHPRLIAFEGDFLNEQNHLENYQKEIFKWANSLKIELKNEYRPFYPHTTMIRRDFDEKKWQDAFVPTPFYISNIHLYESLGNSNYKILKSYPLKSAFEEMQHTADIAYIIRGKDFDEIYINAAVALAFQFPLICVYVEKGRSCSSLLEVIAALNEHVSHADIEWGCNFKAVSFHDKIKKTEDGYYEWEMIIDV